jgi:hypothetical protein
MKYLNIYWIGIIGIAGKGSNYREVYNPDKTIGDVIETLNNNGFKENNKKIVILKHKPRCLDIDDINNPYWSNETTLREYFTYYGGEVGNDLMLIYCKI